MSYQVLSHIVIHRQVPIPPSSFLPPFPPFLCRNQIIRYFFCMYFYGHFVNSTTLNNIGRPVVTCQTNNPIPAKFAPIWTVRAVSFPFCIAGTILAAKLHNITNPAPAYKCGPGNNLPARAYVFSGPYVYHMRKEK